MNTYKLKIKAPMQNFQVYCFSKNEKDIRNCCYKHGITIISLTKEFKGKVDVETLNAGVEKMYWALLDEYHKLTTFEKLESPTQKQLSLMGFGIRLVCCGTAI